MRGKKKLPPECGTFDKRNLETINFVGWNKKNEYGYFSGWYLYLKILTLNL